MFRWLYRYVFRGIGVIVALGMITILLVAISSHLHRPAHAPAAARAHIERP